MKAWQKIFADKTLDESIELVDDIKIISNDGVEIIAEIEGFKVKTYISYHSPFFPSCNCPQKSPCKHEASLFYYFEKHTDLFSKESGVNEIIETIDEKQLKTFLLNELESNDDLKNKFLDEFQSKSLIDKE